VKRIAGIAQEGSEWSTSVGSRRHDQVVERRVAGVVHRLIVRNGQVRKIIGLDEQERQSVPGSPVPYPVAEFVALDSAIFHIAFPYDHDLIKACFPPPAVFRDGGLIDVDAELSHHLAAQLALRPASGDQQHSLFLTTPGTGRESNNRVSSRVIMPTPLVAGRRQECSLTYLLLLRAPAIRGCAFAERSSVSVPG